MEGFLKLKDGWKNPTRFFILLPDRLQYFKKQGQEKPDGEVLLTAASVIRVLQNGVMTPYLNDGGVTEAKYLQAKKKSPSLIFGISASQDYNEKQYTLTAKNHNDKNLWVHKLAETISKLDWNVFDDSVKEGYLLCKKEKKATRQNCWVVLHSHQISCYRKRSQAKSNPDSPLRTMRLDGGSARAVLDEHPPIRTRVRAHNTMRSVLTDDEDEDDETKESDDGEYRFDGLSEALPSRPRVRSMLSSTSSRNILAISTVTSKTPQNSHARRQTFTEPRELSLGDNTIRRHSMSASKMKKTRGRGFCVSSNGDYRTEELWLFATAPGERDAWMECLTTLLISLNRPVYQSSLLEGYLWHSVKLTASFNKYHVVLGTEGLRFFKKRGDGHTVGEMLLPGGSVCRRNLISQDQSEVFCVSKTDDEGEKPIYLIAETRQERIEWMKIIGQLINSKPSKVNPSSLREGYCFQQSGLLKNLHKRYCILLPDRLEYYKGRNATRPLGHHILPPGAEVDMIASPEATQPFAFYISATGDEGEEKNVMMVGGDEEQLSWLQAIWKLQATKDSRTNLRSRKEGRLWGGWNKKAINNRYCVLLDDRLQIFRRRNDAKPETSISISGSAELEDAEESTSFPLFTLAPTGDEGEKVYYLACQEGRGQKHKWMETLRQLLATKDPRKNISSLQEGYILCGNRRSAHTHRKRFFVLLHDRILWYRGRNDAEELGSMELPGGAECDVVEEDDGVSEDSRDYAERTLMFYVAPTGDESEKKLYLTAYNPDQMECWVTVINKLLATKDSKVYKNSLKEGYLLTAVKLNTGPRKRFVVLLHDRLQIFEGRNHAKPLGVVFLPGGAVCELQDDVTLRSRLAFAVAPTGDWNQKYCYFASRTEASTLDWTNTICALLRTKDSRITEDSLREGYMQCGSKLVQAFQPNRKRYFVLLQDQLQYYKSRNDTNAEGQVMLPGGFSFGVEDESEFMVWIKSSDDAKVKKFYVKSRDAEEMEAWMDSFQKLLDTKDMCKNPLALLEGYLESCTKRSGNFKKMYFVLLEEKLQYFAGRNDKLPVGEFYLPGGAIVHLDKDPNYFGMQSCDDEGALHLHMMGENEAEKRRWANALRRIVAIKSPSIMDNSLKEGYLLQKVGIMESWVRRYLVLTPNQLYSYASKQDLKPKLHLKLKPASSFNWKVTDIGHEMETEGTDDSGKTKKISIAVDNRANHCQWRMQFQIALHIPVVPW